MSNIPLVRAGALAPFSDFLGTLGSPTEKLMRKANLPRSLQERPDVKISLFSGAAFVEAAARHEALPHLGIMVGLGRDLGALGDYGRVISNSLTLYDAIHNAITYERLSNNCCKTQLVRKSGTASLQHISETTDHPNIDLYALALIINVIRLAAGPGWLPRRATIQSKAPTNAAEIASLPGTTLAFGSESTSAYFDDSLLSLPLRHISETSSETQAVALQRLQQTSVKHDFIGSLRQALMAYIQDGTDNVDLAADLAGVSRRTLQRRLTDAGYTYFSLTDRIRFEEAILLLRDSVLQVGDVARFLGYTDPGNFIRAFKRWTGTTPLEFRRLQALSPPSAGPL
jgi:AraC-like DNA-binding protein